MSGSLFKALGGGQPSAVQQPSAPVAPPPGGSAAGSPQLDSLFQALQQSQANQPLQPGPMIASNDPIPTAVKDQMAGAFGAKPKGPAQQGVGANPNPNDYENKANAAMDAKQAQAMREHPEWFK